MKYSIIIPTYNNAKYLKRCLDSITNQTCKKFDVIIVDDGSTDNTKEIIKPYLNEKYIKYFYKKNTGVANSRNFGISKVKTPYFLFIDSDDYVPTNLIETIEKYDNYDLLSFKSLKIDEYGNIIEPLEKKAFNSIDGKNYLFELMSNRCLYFFLSPWGYVYKKSMWDKNEFKYSDNYILEDSGLIPLVILNCTNIISIDYYGYYYVQTEESIMRTKNNKKIEFKTKSILYQYDLLIDYINNNTYEQEFKDMYCNYFSCWLLWYGTTLKYIYLNNYIKELKKRDILHNLKIKNYNIPLKFLICKISYKLYFTLYNIRLAIMKR